MIILSNLMLYLSGHYDIARGMMMVIMAVGAWGITWFVCAGDLD